ncbi:DNA-binding transcriptional ArsR family regulator [Salinibacterium sp. CAN_S4]|uniref:ArsR/SmtB family transcription factor n=1 Tax=Salinibacterium sp. CAN_S4 TaxID=2787727 RepID=UPI0018F00B50
MDEHQGLTATADLFKVLSSESRLLLVKLLAAEPATVGTLVNKTGMSQPLVSQHLRTLRQANILIVARSGREATYQLADHHIAHVIDDAIIHVLEERTNTTEGETP